jgi:hypothetical protein
VSVDKIYSMTRDRRRAWMFRGCIFLMGRSGGGGGFDPENAKPALGQ